MSIIFQIARVWLTNSDGSITKKNKIKLTVACTIIFVGNVTLRPYHDFSRMKTHKHIGMRG